MPVLVYFQNNTKANVQLALSVYRASKNTTHFSFYIFFILLLESVERERFFRKWLNPTLPSQLPEMLTYSLCSLQEVSRVSTLLASNNDIQGPNVRLGNAGLQASDKILFCFLFIPQRNLP